MSKSKNKKLIKRNMQTEIVLNQAVQTETCSAAPRRVVPRLSRKARLGLAGFALLVSGVLGAVGLNGILPAPVNQARVTDRVAWYVQHDQLKADLQTLSFAVGYLLESGSEISGPVAPTAPPLAQTGTQAPAKS